MKNSNFIEDIWENIKYCIQHTYLNLPSEKKLTYSMSKCGEGDKLDVNFWIKECCMLSDALDI